jgi:glycosyltransferase involved in cell wall biosynthesis
MSQDAVSEAQAAFCDFENLIVIRKCYEYALRPGITVGVGGLSNDPLFSTWPEVNVWKQKVKARLTGRQLNILDNVKGTGDCRTSQCPKLTVVITTYNRTAELFENLNSLDKQTDKDFEVIVIDNGGDLSRLREEASRFTFAICAIELEENFGPSLAKNMGIEFAKAPYMAFLDDDVVADCNLVGNIIKHFEDYDITGMRGRILTKSGEGSRCVFAGCDLGDEIMMTSCSASAFSAFRKDALVKVGGFDESLFGVEGTELSYRIYRSQNEKEKSILYFPDLVVYHDCSREGPVFILKASRHRWTAQLARQRDSLIGGYAEYMRSLWPGRKHEIENDYHRVMEIARFFQKDNPQEALIWSEKAVKLKPDGVDACYMLGCLYAGFEQYERAQFIFEKILGPLRAALLEGEPASLGPGFRDVTAIGLCYYDTRLRLMTCYRKQGLHERAKEVYASLSAVKNSPLLDSAKREDSVFSEAGEAGEFSSAAVNVEERDVPVRRIEAEGGGLKEESVIGSGDDVGKRDAEYDVSIVICTKDRAELLDQMFDSLKDATRGVACEIIVVEGGSRDNTLEVLRKHGVAKIYDESELLGQGPREVGDVRQ